MFIVQIKYLFQLTQILTKLTQKLPNLPKTHLERDASLNTTGYAKQIRKKYENATVGQSQFESENHDTKQVSQGGTKSVTVHAGNGLQEIATRNKNAVNCSVLQLTASVCEPQNSGSGTRTPDTRIMIPLL